LLAQIGVKFEAVEMNKRYTMLALLALGASPLAAKAQQPGKVWRIGSLGTGSGPNENMEALREELRSLGYIEGRNLVIEYRWAAGKEERLPELAAELVALRVDIIVTQATLPVMAAKRATDTIPIIMTAPTDAVASGLVASLARPGGNITGMTFLSTDLAGKRLQLLREVLPKATRVAVLTYKGTAGGTELLLEKLQAAARQMGITLIVRKENDAAALAGAFAAMQRERAQALIVQATPFTGENRKRIVDLAAQHRLPTLIESRAFVDVGGLMSYGPNLPEMYRRSAHYVDRIFKGAKPADLPVEQPAKFEMVVNLKTAKALGLTIPQSVLARADEVIQ
jgi:putative ABC transport system substrate-binding protein